MSSRWIAGVRSVALEVPDLDRAEHFYTRVWHLELAARAEGAIYLRGTGGDHHLLSLHQGGTVARVRHVTLRAHGGEALHAVEVAARSAGAEVTAPPARLDEPGGGFGLYFRDPEGRSIQVVHGDEWRSDSPERRDYPTRLAHVVLNSEDVATSTAFYERALAFKLVDRTRIMAFLNCSADHHSIALADADNTALNHIAFAMPDLESVMRGGGRMREAGHAIEWGPGRHGPGDNAFNYFIDPFGVVIEYTAEVEQIDDEYAVGAPDDWTWPASRVDQWGISEPPSARLKRAQRSTFFVPKGA